MRLAREHNMQRVWIFVPTLELPDAPEEAAELIELASRKGFSDLALSEVYADQDITSIIVAE